MTVSKTVLACALTLAFAAPAMASEVEVYGKANVSFQSSDDGAGSYTDLKSNASRFGLKGDLTLENDLTVVYKYEVQIDLADEAGEKNLKARNQYVGLKGSFGEILVGRNDSVLKQSQGKIDLFNDYAADLKKQWKGENRISDSITYKTVKFNHFQFGISYIVEGETDGQDGLSAALTYGDKKLKKSNFYAAVAIDSDVKGYDTSRVVGYFKTAGVKLGLGFQTQEASSGGNSDSGFLLNAAYPLGKTTFKAQFQSMEDDNSVSIGADYKLGKKTKLFAWATTLDYDVASNKDYLAVGIEHKF